MYFVLYFTTLFPLVFGPHLTYTSRRPHCPALPVPFHSFLIPHAVQVLWQSAAVIKTFYYVAIDSKFGSTVACID